MADAHHPDPKRRRKIPVLVWVILATLAAWLLYILVAQGGTHVTPSGGTTPQPRSDTAVMPAAPSTDGLPATPEKTIETGVSPDAH